MYRKNTATNFKLKREFNFEVDLVGDAVDAQHHFSAHRKPKSRLLSAFG
jgi:hypothetical protein